MNGLNHNMFRINVVSFGCRIAWRDMMCSVEREGMNSRIDYPIVQL